MATKTKAIKEFYYKVSGELRTAIKKLIQAALIEKPKEGETFQEYYKRVFAERVNSSKYDTSQTHDDILVFLEIDEGKSGGAFQHWMKEEEIEYMTAIGSYKGEVNPSYIVLHKDFAAKIRRSDWVRKQESFLFANYVTGNAYLVYNKTNKIELLGHIKQSEEEPDSEGWTYISDEDTYLYV